VKIVSRHLLSGFVGASTVVFLALCVTWFAVETLLHIEHLASAPGLALREILSRTLEVAPIGIPIACMVGAVWSLTLATRNREIIAVRCGGIRLRRALTPILALCVLLGGGLAVFEDRVLIPLREMLRERTLESTGGPSARIQVSQGRYWYAHGDSIFSAQSYRPTTKTMLGVTLFRIDERHGISERIEATEAQSLPSGEWELREARILKFDHAGGIDQRRALAIRIDLGLSDHDMEIASRPPDLLTLHRLVQSIRESQSEPKEAIRMETALHRRLSHPLSVLVLVLLAIPFAVTDADRHDSLPKAMLIAIGCAMAYWGLGTASQIIGASGYAPPSLTIWSLPFAAISVGLWRFHGIKE
jgi:lipopolysaccharide export system permease protein